MTATETPAGMQSLIANMEPVSRDEFFRRMKTDPRDIMPSHNDRTFTVWRIVRTGETIGISKPGWANPGDAGLWYWTK